MLWCLVIFLTLVLTAFLLLLQVRLLLLYVCEGNSITGMVCGRRPSRHFDAWIGPSGHWSSGIVSFGCMVYVTDSRPF